MKEFFKLNFKWIIGAAILIFVYFRSCAPAKQLPPQITIVRDSSTVQQQQPPIIIQPYQPAAPNISYPVIIPNQYNPSQDIAKLTAQYNELVTKFLATKTYRDSIQLKDSVGKRVGVVDLTQIVSENELKSTQPTYQLAFPHTTIRETITIRESYKPRNQVYAGIGGQATPSMQQLELGFLLKNKKDVALGLSGTYTLQGGQPGIRAILYKKITFKKQ